MLNKGAYIVDAVRALRDILRRMEDHQLKKRALLRELRVAHARLEPAGNTNPGATSQASVPHSP